MRVICHLGTRMVEQNKETEGKHVFTFTYTIKLQGSRKLKAENKEIAIFKMQEALGKSIKELRNDSIIFHLDSRGSFQLVEVDGNEVSHEERDELSRNYNMEI
jgi:hypothetical protein